VGPALSAGGSGIYDEGLFGSFGCHWSAGSLPERSHVV